MKFRHLPVTSAQDTTQNFEQLQGILPNTALPLDARYLQLLSGAHRVAFGAGNVEWTAKAFASQKELTVTTGLASIAAAVAVTHSSESFCSVGVSGGALFVAAVGRIEQAPGTKVEVFWIAIGT